MTSSAPAATKAWSVREVSGTDARGLDAIAELHMELLDFGPMAGLGRAFVRDICYAAHMRDGLLRAALVEVEGEPAGFVAYTSQSIGFHRSGLREHWLGAGLAVASALAQDPRRIVKLVRALKVLVSRRHETILGADPLGEVVSVAVRKQYLAPAFVRRTGARLSEALIRYAGAELARAGATKMRMIVDADNKPALMLYHLMGAHFEPYEQAGEPRMHVWFDLEAASATPHAAGDQQAWHAYWERIEDTQRVFSIEAADYVARVLRLLRPGRDARVLDFGCGFGYAARELAPHVGHVRLWDASASVRRRAAERIAQVPNAGVVDLSAEAADERIGPIDLILAHSVLQYMNESEIENWLGRWRRMLAPRGQIVLSDLLLPGAGGRAEILGYLRFAAANGFFVDAFVSGVREAFHYWGARSSRPLTVVSRATLEHQAQEAGLAIRWLPENLSHRARRATAVLSL